LGTAFFVAFLFYKVERSLGKAQNENGKNSKGRIYFLRGLQVVAVAVLMAAAINNVSVIVSAMP
jgi:hypothetical protein